MISGFQSADELFNFLETNGLMPQSVTRISDDESESDSELSDTESNSESESDDDDLHADDIADEIGNQLFEIREKLTDGEFKNLMDNLRDLRKTKIREKIMPDPELVKQVENQHTQILELEAFKLKQELEETKLKQGCIILKYSIHKIMDSSKSNNKKINMLTDLMNADEKKILANPLLSDIFPYTKPLINLNRNLQISSI